MLSSITGKARVILIIEIVVGILIAVSAYFVFSIPSQAPTPTSSPQFSTFISSPLQITLQYPYGWKQDPTFNGIPGIERYSGADGFFEVGATNSSSPKKGIIIKKYPKPIILGETKYYYFTLMADEAHLKSISDSVQFL